MSQHLLISPFLFHNIHSLFPILPSSPCTFSNFLSSDGGIGQSQDDSIVGTKQCRHSVAIMPIPSSLSSSSPDLLQPATSVLDFSNPAGKKQVSVWEQV